MLDNRGNKAESRDELRRTRRSWVIIAGVAIVGLVSAIRAAALRIEAARWKSITITALESFLAVYPFVGVTLAILGFGLLAVVVRLPRRSKIRWHLARVLSLTATIGLSLLLLEGLAAVSLAWRHRVPAFQSQSRGQSRTGRSLSDTTRGDIRIVVIGESSAEGVPYRDWISAAKIVTWRLRMMFPSRMFHLETQARAGWTLEQMQQKLAERSEAPDILIVYAGHNEFASRFGWSQDAAYYHDELSSHSMIRVIVGWARGMPLYRWADETRQRELVSMRPPPSDRRIVDRPSYTHDQWNERFADFQRRLEAITDYCQQQGVVCVFVIPPGNDAGFEPNRSILPAETPGAERENFAREVREARELERSDTTGAIDRYRSLIAKQPGFAETHFRLARLLERAGDSNGAHEEYVFARDLDGHPMRCPSAFQELYRRLAPRCGAIVIDGQACFRSSLPDQISQLDDRLFNDAMHPSFEGQVLLAEAITNGLLRNAFHGEKQQPTVSIDRAECAKHFDVYDVAWRAAADFGAGFYGIVIPIRYDGSERSLKRERYAEAVRALDEGRQAESLDFPGIGVRSVPDRFRP